LSVLGAAAAAANAVVPPMVNFKKKSGVLNPDVNGTPMTARAELRFFFIEIAGWGAAVVEDAERAVRTGTGLHAMLGSGEQATGFHRKYLRTGRKSIWLESEGLGGSGAATVLRWRLLRMG